MTTFKSNMYHATTGLDW